MTAVLTLSQRPGLNPKSNASFVHADDLRTTFATMMSQMYRNEVPLYGDLVRIVNDVNREAQAGRINSDSLSRLTLERHGAIRLGTPEELQTVRRLFAVLGMEAVGYYDLSAAGLPMHATCFRPTAKTSLATNPFRIFTTLLRPDLITSKEARDLALKLLSKRSLFNDEFYNILNVAEVQHGLNAEQAEVFIREALKVFSWAPVASSTSQEYGVLKAQHPILADIACFKTAHINHLTPRTLNISVTHSTMKQERIAVKDRIEGPPIRKCPILLRQTSFLALEESVKFQNSEDQLINGSHKARFGEIEERGAAVTPAGRKLYDKLLDDSMTAGAGKTPEQVDQILADTFKQFADSWSELRQKGLIYCQYKYTGKVIVASDDLELSLEPSVIHKLVDQGYLEASPITYEDFLPFSAAGIFQSNLTGNSGNGKAIFEASPDQEGFEAALGRQVVDYDVLYDDEQRKSLEISFSNIRKAMISRK